MYFVLIILAAYLGCFVLALFKDELTFRNQSVPTGALSGILIAIHLKPHFGDDVAIATGILVAIAIMLLSLIRVTVCALVKICNDDILPERVRWATFALELILAIFCIIMLYTQIFSYHFLQK